MGIDPQVHKMVTSNSRRNIVTQNRYRHDSVDGKGLCEDIIFDILTRVPARILHRTMRYVSKTWLGMITDPVFVDAHLNVTRSGMLMDNNDVLWRRRHSKVTVVGSDRRVQYRFATGEIVLGSCNGLLLLLGLNAAKENRYIDGRVAIFNPATGWRSTLRPLPVPSGPSILSADVRGGIGFDPVSKEYKVVVFFRCIDHEDWNCNVLTVGYGHWRRVHGLPRSLNLYDYSHPSVLSNSSLLNWIHDAQGCHIGTLDITSWDGKCRRIEFNDIFRRIEFNEEMKKGRQFGLMVMGGCLAVSLLSRYNDVVIWTFDEDKIWTKRIIIVDWISWPIGILETSRSSSCGEYVLIVIGYKRTLRGIPHSTKGAKRVTDNHLTDFIFTDDAGHAGCHSAYAHTDSLVSLSATNY